MRSQKSSIKIWVLSILLITVLVTTACTPKDENKNEDSNNSVTQTEEPTLEEIFGMDKKEAGTELYYSENLKVGFTYLPNPQEGLNIKVSEVGDKIYIHDASSPIETGRSIEVFTKNPQQSLAEAIEENFLQGYDSKDCFVKITGMIDQNPNYENAVISFPPSNDPNGPWWQNAEKCPKNYSETNAIQYFLMDKEVPEKFFFLTLGQESLTSDGTPGTDVNRPDWSQSIKILQ